MKTTKFLLVLLALSMFAFVSSASAQEVTWTGNVQADFAMYVDPTTGDRNSPDADGKCVFNFIKRHGVHNVSCEFEGLYPGDYQVSVGVGGTCDNNTILMTFGVDSNGWAELYVTHTDLIGNLILDGVIPDIARVVPLGGGCNTHLTSPISPYTNPYGDTGQLTERGAMRVK